MTIFCMATDVYTTFIIYVGRELLLTSNPPSPNGLYCPGPVVFTCVGTGIPLSLKWGLMNETDVVATYGYIRDITDPFTLPLSISLPGVKVEVISVTQLNDMTMNINSTLRLENISTLAALMTPVICQSVDIKNETNIIQLRPPCKFKISRLHLYLHLSVFYFCDLAILATKALEPLHLPPSCHTQLDNIHV